MDVQSYREDGTPLTLGLKLIPKLASLIQDGNYVKIVSGYDLVLFCELWICNLSSLPIVFGAPSSQIVLKELNDPLQNVRIEGNRKMVAEAAINEISSLLEFGEKGRVIGKDDEDQHQISRDIRILPKQQSMEVFGT